MPSLKSVDGSRNWTVEELRVLAAIYFNANFSIGDDARDECRAIADCFGRTPASIDRQWRNLDAVVKGKPAYNIGNLVRQAATDYLAHPAGSKAVAVSICQDLGWPLISLITEGSQAPLITGKNGETDGEIRLAFRNLLDHLDFKLFASGSQGFFCQGKIRLEDGRRYQAQVTAVLIGSKADLTIHVRATRDDVAFALQPLLDQLENKRFKTGRVGYYINGKVTVGSERFQVGIQAVEIGEK
jgi:hypothetical protein